MSREAQVPGGFPGAGVAVFVNETTDDEMQAPGAQFLNEAGGGGGGPVTVQSQYFMAA